MVIVRAALPGLRPSFTSTPLSGAPALSAKRSVAQSVRSAAAAKRERVSMNNDRSARSRMPLVWKEASISPRRTYIERNPLVKGAFMRKLLVVVSLVALPLFAQDAAKVGPDI